MLRVVADLGNTRLKWARVDEIGHLVDRIAVPANQPETWDAAWARWSHHEPAHSTHWAISTVNPPVETARAAFLDACGNSNVTWYRTAAQVPIPHDMEDPDTGGADRALAVAAAIRLLARGQPGLLVSCGTAVTIERITSEGTWQGGIIAPGLGLSARALHLLTAQLPMIELRETPAAWGRSTRPSMEAGIYWGTVGAIRELLTRQADDMDGVPAVIWTGGDARLLAHAVAGTNARIEPDLVLLGLAQVAFS